MRRADVLIEVQELADLIAAGTGPVVADCRFALTDPAAGERAWREAHIPGAHYLHLARDLSGPRAGVGGRHPLPDARHFTATMRRIGLDAGRLLVACDASRGAYAARLWWLARHFGHASVRFLDGGWDAWCAAGLARDALQPVAAAGNFTARADARARVDYDELVQMRVSGAAPRLIDSREARRYQGLEEPIDPVAGHIPGAANRPWAEATDAGGFFLDEAAHAARWRGLGPASGLVVYCGSGVTACVNLVSLALAGLDGARLYPGSWSDWCSRMGAPIATGTDPG